MKLTSTVLLLLTVFTVLAYSQKTKPIDYSQRIEESTPKPLPQTPAVKRQTSDAQDDNLKGKVKSVVGERVGLIGVEKPVGRRTLAFTEFDEHGNYLRTVNFEYQGRPYGVSVYGFIDGARVSLHKSIKYGDELYVVGPKSKKKTEEKPQSDPRFSYKYEYKYLNGKVSEMQIITNTGGKGNRVVYNYKGNQRDYLVYTEEGELNQKYLYTLDEKGNDIEQLYFNVRKQEPTIDSKYRYEYESFDKQGNWTKRTMSKSEIENGKEIFKPIAVEYRLIKYYL